MNHATTNNNEEETPLIQPIAPTAVQRLVAGQAVTDLSSAVKELVDNSIDAGATRINIKLYDQGLEAIEVSDNGSGVPNSSRPMMAMKHATSKIRLFDDLYSQNMTSLKNNNDNCNKDVPDNHVHQNQNTDSATEDNNTDCAPTLGFRGEALFCLANLSRSLIVSTRTSDENGLGEQFEFNTEGQLITSSIQKVPRAVGTTVTVRGLFESLPVRRVDMCKRITGQRMKLIKMMQGYAILCLGTQFNITDVQSSNTSKSSSKHKSKSLLATSESSKTLEARISSILGPKFLAGLTRIEIDLSDSVLSVSGGEETNNTNASKSAGGKWKLQGLISHAPTSPHPSNARDLQFFSINGRPVDLPSVSRLLGDVWRLFDPSAETKGNGKGSSSTGRLRCASILALTLPNNMYDVNLSPDKREVMFTEETAMSDLIREGLMELWTSQSEGKFTANEVESRSNKNMIRNVSAKKSETKGIATEENNEVDDDDSDETDNITPKLRRRSMGDDGTLVTPGVDSNGPKKTKLTNAFRGKGQGTNCNDQAGDSNGVPSISQGHNQQLKETAAKQREGDNASLQQEEKITPLHHANDKDQHNQSQSQRGWSQMQLPERAREPDRKVWEQMRLNFQRIEKKQLHQDMESIISSDDDGAEHINNDRHLRTKTKSTAISEQQTSSNNNKSSSNRGPMSSDRSDSRRQRKRQKRNKEDVTSLLDSFAFGAAKPPTADEDNGSDGSESHLSEEESETLNVQEIVEKFSRRLSRQDDGQRNARMVVGKTMMTAEKPSRTSLRKNALVEESYTSHPSQVVVEGEVDDEDDKSNESDDYCPAPPPIEAVWDHFSGTQNVIAQAQHARLMLQKNRKQLLSSVKRKRANGIDDQDAKLSSNNDVEEDSTVNLCKGDFLHMSIIGQFNLGFILARCRNHNLWILDQHACDEKYNFERLCKETVIHEQKLIAPLPLELSPSEEHCVLENMEMFEQNGFRFSYDPDKDPRHRLSLTALPHSGSGADGKKAVQFGKEDVGALCAMLGAHGTSSSEGYIAGFDTGVEGGRIAGVNAVRRYAGSSQSDGIVGSSIVRLPKAIAMFASRACRGSIMIGTALSHKEQVNILKKLDKTDIPWNCAHGRPTMSHIRSLAKCLIEDDNANAAHVAGPSLSLL